jgi:CRP/FNR family transcriptional regulator, anaerobic regulatory protein
MMNIGGFEVIFLNSRHNFDCTMRLNQILHERYPDFSDSLIEEIIENGQLKEIPKDTVLMDVGKTIQSIPLILEGNLKVLRPDEDGNELFLYYLYPGDACALSLVCSFSNRNGNVRAETIEDSTVLFVPIKFMDEWMTKHRSWYHYVLTTYRRRLEDVLQTVDSIAFHNMDERLVDYLKKAMELNGSNLILTTHQDIASELNSSREVISRLLKKLEQRGKIKIGRNKIEVLDI